jgi:DNA-binding transcriptional MerR regulator
MEGGPKDRKFLLAGELAFATGVSTDTLRHYERKGVLPRPARSANGYRRYPAESRDRVRMIRNALAVGFTLDELARLLGERDKGGAPCREVRAMAAEKLADIEEQLKSLVALRDDLQTTIEDWDTRLSTTPPDTQAGLLEWLSPALANDRPFSKFKKKVKRNDKNTNK